jgi:hypothetical protein
MAPVRAARCWRTVVCQLAFPALCSADGTRGTATIERFNGNLKARNEGEPREGGIAEMEPDYRRASLDNRQGHPVLELHDPCVAAFYWTAAASLTLFLVDRPTCLQDGAAQLQAALGCL